MSRTRLVVFAALLAVACAASAQEDRESIRRTPIVTAISRVRDCVVNISTERVVDVRRGLGSFGGDPFDQLFEEFWSGPNVERRRVKSPLGSGAIITSDGLVITNEHVINRATTIYLTLDTGERFEAELLGADPKEDIALLRAKTDKPLKAITMGDSSDLLLGETVIALGNPFGFENSVTSGIISALDRDITVGGGENGIEYSGLIQTSALINPGNSGGPLVNIFGEMIGINVAVVDQAQGIGFAIPIARARQVVASLLTVPNVSEAWIGLTGESNGKEPGVRVTAVEKDGPGAGRVEMDDVVDGVNGHPVRDLFDLNLAVAQFKPGDTISLSLKHKGEPLTVTMTVGKMPELPPATLLKDKIGIKGQDMNADMARALGAAVSTGLLVSDVVRGGPADQAGIIRGDVIIRLGRSQVRNLADAASVLRNTHPGDSVAITIVRQNYRASGVLTVAK